jgi:hypothetical protein
MDLDGKCLEGGDDKKKRLSMKRINLPFLFLCVQGACGEEERIPEQIKENGIFLLPLVFK